MNDTDPAVLLFVIVQNIRHSLIGAVFIHNDKFPIRKCLRYDAVNCLIDICLTIVDRHNNRYFWHVVSLAISLILQVLFPAQIFIENAHHQVVKNHVNIFCHLHAVDRCVQRNIRKLL